MAYCKVEHRSLTADEFFVTRDFVVHVLDKTGGHETEEGIEVTFEFGPSPSTLAGGAGTDRIALTPAAVEILGSPGWLRIAAPQEPFDLDHLARDRDLLLGFEPESS